MTETVWISDVFSSGGINSTNGGLRRKFYHEEWSPASFSVPMVSERVYQALLRNQSGYALDRTEFTEAAAVFDEVAFSKVLDVFYLGPFLAVKGLLAQTLSRFNFGDGGLVPCPIYRADLVTPIEGSFYILNFGARKDSILPNSSENVVPFLIKPETGEQVWKVNSWCKDGDVAMSRSALIGADIWMESVYNKVFMKDAVAQALIQIGMKDAFALKSCRVIGA